MQNGSVDLLHNLAVTHSFQGPGDLLSVWHGSRHLVSPIDLFLVEMATLAAVMPLRVGDAVGCAGAGAGGRVLRVAAAAESGVALALARADMPTDRCRRQVGGAET